ncbi:MAG: glycosyltransferase family 39 protein [Candidatus Omnitrophica bacterium]|nr:glycosyltransferase family 39 protein [Candidatus Omnitrophota bacterium]MDD5552734.1 glycosyltransferase family 39 protein [Candidatus Omnitrophota bacterium]
MKYGKHFLGFVVILYAVFFMAVSPLREFPSGDAWVYSMAVRDFLKTYQLKLPQLCLTSFLPQILWGSFFCLFSKGFSFGMLNLSTFILSLAGSASFYLILKRLRIKEELCALGALCLILNPVYFFLTFTFMLDVPCLALMLISVLLYLKGLDEGSDRTLFLASLPCAASLLIKQQGAVIPFSFALYLFLTQKKERILLKKIILSCIVPFIVFCVYITWYILFYLPGSIVAFYHPLSAASSSYSDRFSYLKDVPRNLFIVLLYLGIFITPLLLGSLSAVKKAFKDKKIAIAGLIFSAITIKLAFGFLPRVVSGNFLDTNLMPYGLAIMHKWGVGPVSILGDKSIFFNSGQQMFITLISFLSALALAMALLVRLPTLFREDKRNLIFIIGILQLMFMLFFMLRYADHNLVYFLPMAILLAIEVLEKTGFSRAAVIAGLALMAFYSILGTRDYMNWNQARWEAANDLLKEGVAANNIEGGYEWGYLVYSDSAVEKRRKEIEANQEDKYTTPKWIAYIEPKYDPEYIISFSPSLRKGDYLHRFSSAKNTSGLRSEWDFKAYRRKQYYNALKFRKENIYVLKRILRE